MSASNKADHKRWLHHGCRALALLLCACASDTPVSPGASPTPSTPEVPAAPATPGAATLVLSRQDVVFNAVAGTALRDSAAITVTAASAVALRDLRAAIRLGPGTPEGWLAVELDQTTSPATLSVRTNSAGLAVGEFKATVMLTATGAAAESLTVTTRVMTGAAIGLNASKICFTTLLGDTTHRDDVLITSIDGSVIDGLMTTITYDAGQPTGWLDASLTTTRAPARLWLRGSPGTLPLGTYNATVQVSSPNAGNSPVSIRVTMTVNQPATSTVHVMIRREGNYVGTAVIVQMSGGDTYCSDPPNPFAGQRCDITYAGGTGESTLWSDADYGEQLLGWEGCTSIGAGDQPCQVESTHPGTSITVTGIFGPLPSQRTLKVNATGPGSVISQDRFISTDATVCQPSDPQPCQTSGHYYPPSEVVELIATPGAEATFVGWTDCPSPSGTFCDVPMTEDRSVVAQFAPAAPGLRTSLRSR